MEKMLGTKDKFSVTYENLFDDVEVGQKIKLDDGNLTLLVTVNSIVKKSTDGEISLY